MAVPSSEVERRVLEINSLLVDRRLALSPNESPNQVEVTLFASLPNFYQAVKQTVLTIESVLDCIVFRDDERRPILAVLHTGQLVCVGLRLDEVVNCLGVPVVRGVVQR